MLIFFFQEEHQNVRHNRVHEVKFGKLNHLLTILDRYLKRLLLRCLLDRNLLNDDRQHKIVNKKTQFLRFGRG